MMKKAISEGFLQTATVGSPGIKVSHLQYADDTLFVLNGNKENAETLRWLLKNFELVSGLEVNFDKSCVYGVNLDQEKMEEIAEALRCRADSLPVPYLGLKIGGRINGIEKWLEVVEKMKGRLRNWDASSISMGGRCTIVNSILTTMPLYCMSIFPLPKKVATQLKTLQCNFLWGGNVDLRKMAWVKWNDLCKPKKDGGLGIKDLLLFNKALLSKWVWRFLTNNKSLWSRTIIARHGGILLNHTGQMAVSERGCKSGWWSKVLATTGRVDNGWFWRKISQKLGNGNTISFWNDCWVSDRPLRDLYPRLYHLSANREGKVREMGSMIDARWKWDVAWRRAPLEREMEGVERFFSCLDNFSVKEDVMDKWMWAGSSSGEFSVKNAYSTLTRTLARGSV